MITYFADRDMKIIGNASTNLTNSYVIVDDVRKSDIDTGVTTFELRIIFNDADRLPLQSMTAVGNYFMVYSGKETRSKDGYSVNAFEDFYIITQSEVDIKSKTIYIYGENAGLDLLNDIAGSYSGVEQRLSDYVSYFLQGTDFTIVDNIPEDQQQQKSLSWTSSETVIARLQNIASEFECEFKFGFTIVGVTVTKKWIEFYKERGHDTNEVVAINRGADNIVVKNSIENLATALLPTGANNLTFGSGQGYSWSDEEGDFHTSGLYLVSERALETWARYSYDGDQDFGHIYRLFSCNATTQEDLRIAAVEELKKRCVPEVNYDVDVEILPENVGLGDRINVVDDAGSLYISGRILSMEKSVTGNYNRITLGEWKIKSAGISEVVANLAKNFAALAADRNYYTWIVYANLVGGVYTNLSKDSTNREYIGIKNNQPTEDFDISEVTASDFIWSKIAAEDGASVLDVKTFYQKEDIKPDTPDLPEPGTPVEEIIESVPEGWSESEPAYEPENPTPDLYKIVRIVYSDGTVQYSQINVDSAFTSVKYVSDEIDEAAKTATNYLAYVDSANGLRIYDGQESNKNVNFTQVNSDGLEVYSGGQDATNIVASFGSEGAQIGAVNSPRFTVGTDHITGYNSDSVKYFEVDMNGSQRTEVVEFGGYFVTKSQPEIPTELGLISRREILVPMGLEDGDTIDINTFYYRTRFLQGTEATKLPDSCTTNNCTATIISNFHVRVIPNLTSLTVGTAVTDSSDVTITMRDGTELYFALDLIYVPSEYKIVFVLSGRGDATAPEVLDIVGRISSQGTMVTNSPIITLGSRDDTSPGSYSVTVGEHLKASSDNQIVLGKFNVEDANSAYSLIVGNGTSDSARSNSMTLGSTGNLTVSGTITDGSGNSIPSVETPSISIGTPTVGNLVSSSVRKYGNVVQLTVRVSNSSTISAGGSLFSATINTTELRPKVITTTAGMNATRFGVGEIDTSGVIRINAVSSWSATAAGYFSFTYIV